MREGECGCGVGGEDEADASRAELLYLGRGERLQCGGGYFDIDGLASAHLDGQARIGEAGDLVEALEINGLRAGADRADPDRGKLAELQLCQILDVLPKIDQRQGDTGRRGRRWRSFQRERRLHVDRRCGNRAVGAIILRHRRNAKACKRSKLRRRQGGDGGARIKDRHLGPWRDGDRNLTLEGEGLFDRKDQGSVRDRDRRQAKRNCLRNFSPGKPFYVNRGVADDIGASSGRSPLGRIDLIQGDVIEKPADSDGDCSGRSDGECGQIRWVQPVDAGSGYAGQRGSCDVERHCARQICPIEVTVIGGELEQHLFSSAVDAVEIDIAVKDCEVLRIKPDAGGVGPGYIRGEIKGARHRDAIDDGPRRETVADKQVISTNSDAVGGAVEH